MVRALMDWQGWFTLAVLALVIVGMVREYAGTDFIIGAGLCALAVTGILTPREAFAGFANPALAAIAGLFVVSAGLRETGLIDGWIARLFSGDRPASSALLRMCPPLAAMSAFLNNAPIVASVTPVLLDWTRRRSIPASRFLIPVSYATVLGSSTTLIGTSVNLTVAGLMVTAGLAPMGLFELAPVGIAMVTVGTLYLAFVGSRLLPDRQEPAEYVGGHRREYVTAMRVEEGCPLAGQTVREAGLRQLPGLYLVEIDREGRTLTPVGPEEVVRPGDELVFAGVVTTIVDLQRIPGLSPANVDEKASQTHRLMEAVISASSPLIHQSVKEARFRTVYDAAVVAVHRNGERLGGKIGDIVLRPGDTLLLQTGRNFLETHRNSPEFYLVSQIDGQSVNPRRGKTWIAVACMVAMVAAIALNLAHTAVAALIAGGAMLYARCLSGSQARQAIDWPVLVVIAAGFGLAHAMEKTGAAAWVAQGLVEVAGDFGPLATLVAVYLATMLLAELLHHAAAAALMIPVALAAASSVSAEPRAFAMAVAVAATCSFANPTTYHTHLIVYGPGGYHFSDFLRVGAPLNLVCALVALVVIPWVWPL